jgi:hypothetical protein
VCIRLRIAIRLVGTQRFIPPVGPGAVVRFRCPVSFLVPGRHRRLAQVAALRPHCAEVVIHREWLRVDRTITDAWLQLIRGCRQVALIATTGLRRLVVATVGSPLALCAPIRLD